MRTRSCGKTGRLRAHDFYTYYPPLHGKCSVTVTSVVGHVFGLDFDEDTGQDPVNLFGAHTRKTIEENTEKFGVVETLIELGTTADRLFLWLDCDREGENICFEVCKSLYVINRIP